MTLLTFIRHPEAAWDLVERHKLRGLGSDLVPLTDAGLAKASELGIALAGQEPCIVLSSPMTRALQAAAVISARVSAPLVVEFDLREWLPAADQRWLGPSVPEQAQRNMRASKGEWPVGETRPWEPMSSVRRRVLVALQPHMGLEHVIVVTHGVLIEAVTGHRIGAGATLELPLHQLRRPETLN
jgi:broad specificity phosphatase PhoE